MLNIVKALRAEGFEVLTGTDGAGFKVFMATHFGRHHFVSGRSLGGRALAIEVSVRGASTGSSTYKSTTTERSFNDATDALERIYEALAADEAYAYRAWATSKIARRVRAERKAGRR